MRASEHSHRRMGPTAPRRHAIAASLAAMVALLAVVALVREAPGERPVVASHVAPATPRPPAPRFGPGSPDYYVRPAPPAAPAGKPASAPTARELVERALQSRDPALRTQAWLLLRHCTFALMPGSLPPLVSPPPWMKWENVRLAEQAWQSLARRCESLRTLPDREAVQRRLDPVPAFGKSGQHALDDERHWLSGTFRQHGGAALLWAGDTLAAYAEQRTNQSDGDRFDQLDPEAVRIARCRFGEDCGADSDAAHAACLTAGVCEGDVPQRLLAALGSRAARERVLREVDALTAALASGDLGRYAIGE